MGTCLSSLPAPTEGSQPPKPPEQIKPVCISEGKPQLKHRSQNHRFPSSLSPQLETHTRFSAFLHHRNHLQPCSALGGISHFGLSKQGRGEQQLLGTLPRVPWPQTEVFWPKKRHRLHLNHHPRGFVLIPTEVRSQIYPGCSRNPALHPINPSLPGLLMHGWDFLIFYCPPTASSRHSRAHGTWFSALPRGTAPSL